MNYTVIYGCHSKLFCVIGASCVYLKKLLGYFCCALLCQCWQNIVPALSISQWLQLLDHSLVEIQHHMRS